MSEQISQYALTNLQRVKDLIFDPNSYINFSGTTTSTSQTIAISSTAGLGLQLGMIISGTGIPSGATITAVGATSISISAAATANGTVPITAINQPSAFDTVLSRYITEVSGFFERATGGRQFVQRQYVNEQITATSRSQRRITLRQSPVTYVFLAGDFAVGTNTILNCTNVNGIQIGMPIFAPGFIPQNGTTFATVTAIIGTTLTISVNASATQLQAAIEVSGLVSLQYLSGTPVTNPSWTAYVPDNFQLKDQGRAGIVRIIGYIPTEWDNGVRVTYWAGYLVNWANFGDDLTHTLPYDITSTVENLVVRAYRRRQIAGANSESLSGSSINWNKEIDDNDKAVIEHYRKMPIIIS